MGKVRVSPAEYAEKWGRRLSGATEDIRRGVDRVTESPTEAAAAAAEKMLARLTAKVLDGTWAAQLRKVSLPEWKDAMKNKGIPRIAAGVSGATAKQVEFATALLAYEESLMGTVEAMPDITLEDSIARATTWMRGMNDFKKP